MIPALAGADELSGIGEMEAGVMGSFAQIVCDNEIAASVRRVIKGFEVNDNSLAIDVISAAMHSSHNFLGQKHTMRYLRTREKYCSPTWQSVARGKAGMPMGVWAWLNMPRLKQIDILQNHLVPPLSEDQERELDEVLHEADQKLKRK